jgi:adenosylmethionine-8-amino-7-oxononanoate aminotransferase
MSAAQLQQVSRRHLWLHFTRMGGHEPPMIVRGDGCFLEDVNGKRYLDALAGLSAVQVGYSYSEEMGHAALAANGDELDSARLFAQSQFVADVMTTEWLRSFAGC